MVFEESGAKTERVIPEEIAPFNEICDFLADRTGLFFDGVRKESLWREVYSRVRGLGIKGCTVYLELLKKQEEEFRSLVDGITIKETYFFRQREHFDVLREVCLPAIMQRNRMSRSMHIWSAACATGEETYSIAMTVLNTVPDSGKWTLDIRGTDISGRALLAARKGIYGKHALRRLDETQRSRFFLPNAAMFRVRPEFREAVRFHFFNLADDPFPVEYMPVWDVIFCRNVMIYFDKERTRRLLDNFHAILHDDGYLFTGHAEMLGYLHTGFQPVEIGGTFVYRKVERRPAVAVQPVAPMLDRKGQKDGSERKMSRLNVRRSRPTDGRKSQRSEKKKRVKTKKTAEPEETVCQSREGSEESLRAAISSEGVNRPEAYLALAKLLADRGETRQATEILDELIRGDPMQPEAYFLLALICFSNGASNEALGYLKKARYLEPSEPIVRMHLAEVYRARGMKEEAAREYANVMAMLENTEKERLETWAGEVTRTALMEAAASHVRNLR